VRYFAGEVLPLVRSEEPDVAFWITGSTEGVDVAGLGRVDGVTFTGRLPDVTQTVAQSLACVVPLRHGGGTRLKVLEAMALGTPVISTSKGIEGLDVEPGVHVLVANEPNDFANQTLRVMRDPALASRLTLAARRRVEDQYGWNAIGEALDAVLADAVSVHPRGA
jgi:polysaccharide biosynthesis protein PslH